MAEEAPTEACPPAGHAADMEEEEVVVLLVEEEEVVDQLSSSRSTRKWFRFLVPIKDA